jgi:hypothetical protein
MKRTAIAVLAGITILALAGAANVAAADVLYSSAMDSVAGWTVNATADTSYQFGFDYSTLGIPASPNGGGTTTGLQMKANLTTGTANYLVATPTGFSVGGTYAVTFDFWVNVNGPFPVGGGGSTEFLGGGVGYDGVTAEKDGSMLLVTGEGGSSRDYRMYREGGEVFTASGQYDTASNNSSDVAISAQFPGQAAPAAQQAAYPQQTGTMADGTAGFAWHEMVVTVDGGAGTVNFAIDGLSIGTLDPAVQAPVPTTGSIQVMYGDLFTSVSDHSDLSFGLVDNLRVTRAVVPEPASLSLLGLGGLALLRRRRS